MSLSNTNGRGQWHTLLVLGRASNVPTVWSNCVAGWWLGGGGPMWKLLLLSFGATCLYVGGMYLNDAFDVEFDRQHRHERPIPSGAVHLEEVWRWSFGWMVVGLTSLLCLGSSVVILTLLLAGAIVLYDAIHKIIAFSPLLMAACRFLLVLLAAAAGVEGITGLALWSAFALGAYIVGLSYIAQFESVRGALRYWPLIFLAAPVVLAHFVDAGEYRFRGTVLSLLLAAWVVWCLRHMFWRGQRNLGHTVSGLLAGIVLVDWLALCSSSPALSLVFPVLFATALIFQRFIPAT